MPASLSRRHLYMHTGLEALHQAVSRTSWSRKGIVCDPKVLLPGVRNDANRGYWHSWWFCKTSYPGHGKLLSGRLKMLWKHANDAILVQYRPLGPNFSKIPSKRWLAADSSFLSPANQTCAGGNQGLPAPIKGNSQRQKMSKPGSVYVQRAVDERLCDSL